MDLIFIIAGIVLIITGLLGSLLPVLPGPPLSYLGLVFLQFTDRAPFDAWFFVTWAAIVVAVSLIDYVIPVYGTKRYGGTPYGVWGSVAGLIGGIFFFPPLGMVVGPLIGAYVGELIGGKDSNQAFRAAKGSFIGFLSGTLLKLIASGVMGYYFFANL